MKDFYYEVKEAFGNASLPRLIEENYADPNLSYSFNDEPIFLNNSVFSGGVSRLNSLDYIFEKSRKTNNEIPFALIIDENNVIDFSFKGKEGTASYCDWKSGNLLSRSEEFAKEKNKKIVLGHTHPVFIRGGKIFEKYGPICSDAYYKERHLRGDDLCSKFIFNSGMYKKFGGDYCEMLFWSKQNSFSDFFVIASPRVDSFGVFRIEDGGKIIYHPWKRVD